MTSDYPAQAGDYKLCPIKRETASDFLIFRNLDVDPDNLATIRDTGAVKPATADRLESIETIAGRCDGSRCAWWDAKREKCGVLTRT